jgi:hypothetical protein
MNLAVLCPNCHSLIHFGRIKIVGIFPSTEQPYGRTLVYKKDGVSNVPGLDEPYYVPELKSMKVFSDEQEDSSTKTTK